MLKVVGRTLRWIGQGGFILLAGALGTSVGLLVALGATATGRALVARLLTEHSGAIVRGRIEIGAVHGSFVRSLTLDSVVVRDTTGTLLAVLPEVEVRYAITSLLAGRIVLDEVRLTRPRIHLRKHREGRLNIEEVLKLGEGDGTGTPALIVLRNVAIDDGILTIRTPWSPPGQLRRAAARDSALRAQRFNPGRRIEDSGPDGLVQIRTIEGLGLRFREVRLSSPDGAPIRIVIDSLAASMNDPLLTVTDARGEITTAGDSLRFTLTHAAMPGTRLTGDGTLTWPRDTLMFNYTFDAPLVDLVDLRFVSEAFPDLQGRGRISAVSFNGMETDYDVRDLVLAGHGSRVEGRLVALTHRLRGLGFRGLDLTLRNFDLDDARPYLDTLPFVGRLDGRLRADGFFDSLTVQLDWSFADSRVAGEPVNRLALEGPITLGGPEGMVFHSTRVPAADLDLETVRLVAPSVILLGRVSGEGQLDGPWKEVEYRGRLEHHDGGRPVTIASGRFGLDTRGTRTIFDADFAFTPLEFDGIRPAFPTLTTQGRLWGPVELRGPVDSLDLVADLQGPLGRVRAEGRITVLPPFWAADSLWLGFEAMDLALVRGTGPTTSLNGSMVLRGAVDSAVAPDGELRLQLGTGSIGAFALDSGAVALTARDSVLTVSGGRLGWAGGQAVGAGVLGWRAPHSGAMDVTFRVGDLSGLDSLLRTATGITPDSADRAGPVSGMASGSVNLRGALDSLSATVALEVPEARLDQYRIGGATGRYETAAGSGGRARFNVSLDSLGVGTLRYAALRLDAVGLRDSLAWEASGQGPYLSATGRGTWLADGGVVGFSALDVGLGASRWRLARPTGIVVDSAIRFVQPMELHRANGSASLRLEGSLPHRADTGSELDLRLFGLDLAEAFALAQQDTTDVRGLLQADLLISGTGLAPRIRGTAALTAPVIRDFRGPLVRAAVNYRDRTLDAHLNVWRTGVPIMEVDASLPIELAWLGVEEDRLLPGSLAIRARAEGLDLAGPVVFSRNLRQVRGLLDMDVAVLGTWADPRLDGSIRLRDGYGTVPGLGVRYGPVDGLIALTGDSLVVDTLTMRSGPGQLNVTGLVRLEELTRPVLDLGLEGRAFQVMNVPDFLVLEADGNVRLTGPVTNPVMIGTAVARNTVLYFTDLVTKDIVNLEDPLYADLVDTAAIRRRQLGSAFQSRFLDSLAIRNFEFRAAERVWLRSEETNVQMEGAVTVNKVRDQYRLEGTFEAVRGTYTLRMLFPPVTRAFDVQRGVIQYFNTPDLNAAVDIEAIHRVASGEYSSQDVDVIARITGTLAAPKLSLESTIRPPLSQSDIVSFLVLGRPLNSQVASEQQARYVETAAAALAGAVGSELERLLVSSGTGVDKVEIRPGSAVSGTSAAYSLSRVSAGWQLGNKWFVGLNAGFCPGLQNFDYRNFGASLEYRLDRSFRFLASAEPVQTCYVGGAVANLRYQLGTDLRWVREF